MTEPRIIKVGDTAEVVTILRPGGFVVVHGERHSARCSDGYLEVGTSVVVVGGDNHGFVVTEVHETIQLETLPDYGKPVYSSFGASAKAAALEAERQMQRWLGKRQKWRLWMGPVLGILFAVVGVFLSWDSLAATAIMPNAVAGEAAVLIGIGAVVGLGLLAVVDQAMLRVDFELHRFSLGITALMLAGITAGLVWMTPRLGLMWGIVAAIGFGFLAGMPLAIGVALIASGDGPESLGPKSST